MIGIVIVPGEHGDRRCFGGGAEDGDGDEREIRWMRGRPREDGGGDVPRASRGGEGRARAWGNGGRRARRE